MTDETRPGRGTPGSEEPKDALAAWFRPEPESEPEAEAEAGSAEGSEAADAAAADEADRPDQAETQALSTGPDNDLTQAIPQSVLKAVASAKAEKAEKKEQPSEAAADSSANDRTQLLPLPVPAAKSAAEPPSGTGSGSAGGSGNSADSASNANDRTQLMPRTPPAPTPKPTPVNLAAAAPTQAIPRTSVPLPPPTAPLPPPIAAPGMAVRGNTSRPPQSSQSYGAEGLNWGAGTAAGARPTGDGRTVEQPHPHYRPAAGPGAGQPPIIPLRGRDDDYDDFDHYEYGDAKGRPPGKRRRGLLVTAGVAALVAAVAAALVFTGTVKVPGVSAKPVPTVGFSPSGSDAGSDTTQTGTAFLTAWQNGNLKAAANITDNPTEALAELTAYKSDLKLSGLTLLPGTATAAGWMTFNVTAQVGTPASAWSYSSGMAAYSSMVDGYTRWFVKWTPSVLFTSLKSGQKLGLGTIPATANKVVDRNGTEITSSNAPSLTGIVKALEQNAPTSDGTPGQTVQIEKADGTLVSSVAKVSDPVNTSAVKTTIDLNVQQAAQSAVGAASNSSMVVIQPSTGDILAVVNNPAGGLDTAMVGKYAPGSTFKTISTTLALNKGVITDLNQTWDCPQTLNLDGITLHNSEQESGVGKSFLWDFAQSCNNAFSRFEGPVSRNDLVGTAHDYYGFNQAWDVGLGQPTVYGNVPNTSSNSLAEELVGQDHIATSPLAMASVAATIANCGFKQPILVPGATQISATALSASTCSNLKTLMRAVITSGTLAGVFNGQSGVYGKTGTAEVGTNKTPNSWTIAFKGDYAVAALAVGGGFGASTAGPEVKTLLNSIS